jgi:hypothetical protein
LLPGGRFEHVFDSILPKLETQAGDGKLDPDEQELLTLARALRDQLSTSPRATPKDWERLGRLFRLDAERPGVVLLKSQKAHGQRG